MNSMRWHGNCKVTAVLFHPLPTLTPSTLMLLCYCGSSPWWINWRSSKEFLSHQGSANWNRRLLQSVRHQEPWWWPDVWPEDLL